MYTTVTKRTLTKWRKEALNEKNIFDKVERTQNGKTMYPIGYIRETQDRILRLTLILLDQELMKGK